MNYQRLCYSCGVIVVVINQLAARYGDSLVNIIEENSSILHLIQM